MPGDAVTFDLNIGNANSDLASRIQVFDGDGRRAAYYPYVAVRYQAGDVVVFSLRRSWIYLFCFVVNVLALLGILWMRGARQPAVSVT